MESDNVTAVWGAESGHIDTAVRDAVAVVTLRRPDKLNALTADACRELAAILRHFGGGDSVRGIVLTGTGRAFSAGLDLREAAGLPPDSLVDHIELFHDITRAALETRVPVVAALNGIAVGGACEMTLCFDARIGTPAAEYLLPENTIGLTISNASSVLLPRLVGHRAMRLVLESARISAADALAMGLLDEIVDEAALVETAIGVVHRWTPPGGATAAHLTLLRPPMAEIEQAMATETEATRATEADGLSHAGISRFLGRPRPAELSQVPTYPVRLVRWRPGDRCGLTRGGGKRRMIGSARCRARGG
jgi:enoyl-CoA hydratase/carnithine racemase